MSRSSFMYQTFRMVRAMFIRFIGPLIQVFGFKGKIRRKKIMVSRRRKQHFCRRIFIRVRLHKRVDRPFFSLQMLQATIEVTTFCKLLCTYLVFSWKIATVMTVAFVPLETVAIFCADQKFVRHRRKQLLDIFYFLC